MTHTTLHHPLRWLGALAVLTTALATAPAQAADVGVSIGINQPGVYGRIDIGRFPQPQVVVQRPVVIYRQAQAPQPIYLRVPTAHRQHWRQHCQAYNACSSPVYFVQERWYQDHVVRAAPRQGERAGRRDDSRGHGGEPRPGRRHD